MIVGSAAGCSVGIAGVCCMTAHYRALGVMITGTVASTWFFRRAKLPEQGGSAKNEDQNQGDSEAGQRPQRQPDARFAPGRLHRFRCLWGGQSPPSWRLLPVRWARLMAAVFLPLLPGCE